MSNNTELKKSTLKRLTEYLEKSQQLDTRQPPFNSAEWETWNAETVELTSEYHDEIVIAIRYFLR